MAYVPKPENWNFGHQAQCAAQCLDNGSHQYLVISDSWVAPRSSRTTSNVVEFGRDSRGESWQSRLRRRAVNERKELAIIAAYKGTTSFAFWVNGNEMMLATLVKGERSEVRNIKERFDKTIKDGISDST